MSNQPNQPKKNQQLNIELPAEVADGTYSNLVMIAHSPEEFILDFIPVMPGLPKARVQSRIVVTPAHAKRLLMALEDNINKYENVYGPIAPGGGQPEFSFQIPGGEA